MIVPKISKKKQFNILKPEDFFSSQQAIVYIVPFLSPTCLRQLMCCTKLLRNTYYKLWISTFIFTVPKVRPVFSSYLNVSHIRKAVWDHSQYISSIPAQYDSTRNVMWDDEDDVEYLRCKCAGIDRLKSYSNLRWLKITFDHYIKYNHDLPILGKENLQLLIPSTKTSYVLNFKNPTQQYIFYTDKNMYNNDNTYMF